MEAIGCGIPLLATAICGNKEILDYGTGYALNEYPTAGEIAVALTDIAARDRNSLLRTRERCREVWKSHYNSTLNYNLFCKRLMSLFE
jgi:glycosyltransferase involved in cell wall biosynthesis